MIRHAAARFDNLATAFDTQHRISARRHRIDPARCIASSRFTPTAPTRISTSPTAGVGRSTCM
ncbi:hypothetical protein HED49_22155 [Ochrobactrum daejeonense]|nr:hypothetical protein [Brucella daejeonensis]